MGLDGSVFSDPCAQLSPQSPDRGFATPHTLSTPLARYDIAQERGRASLVVTLSQAPQIDRSTVIFEAPTLSGPGWQASATALRFATRRLEDAPLSHVLGLQAEALQLPAQLRAELDPRSLLPPAIDTLRLDATLTFDAPWDRRALEVRRPQVTQLDLREARASWGALDLRYAGALSFDDFGFATGEITVQARNWRDMLVIAERSGAVSATALVLLERGLEGLSERTGRPETLDLTISVRGGRMSLGFVPIGQLPPLRLR